MKNNIILSVLLGLAAACGNDSGPDVQCGANTMRMGDECVGEVPTECGAGTVLNTTTNMCDPSPKVFRQTEHLARPGINEALLISDGFHIGYNATAPTFAGVPAADLQAVIGEAKTVLKALYLGACLLNGVAGLTAAQGVHPGTLECVEVGGNIFTNNDALTGTTLKATVAAQAQTYADVLFDLFIPDVMRLDTGIATSTYLSPCSPTVVPTGKGAGLCGGRFLRDDVIDITYDFLLNGAGTCARPAGTNCATANQVSALVGDGVSFDNAVAGNNVDQRIPGDPNNRQQGHPAVTNTFPYSAPPI